MYRVSERQRAIHPRAFSKPARPEHQVSGTGASGPEMILIGWLIPFTNRGPSGGGTVFEKGTDAASQCKGVIVIGAVGPYSVDMSACESFYPGVTQRVGKRVRFSAEVD